MHSRRNIATLLSETRKFGIMKKLILTFTSTFTLFACSASSSFDVDGPKCEVTRNGQFISLLKEYDGDYAIGTVKADKDENGEYYIDSDYLYKYSDKAKVDKACRDLQTQKDVYKDDATLDCNDSIAHLHYVYYGETDWDGNERQNKEACDNFYQKVKEGDLENLF